MNSKNAPLNDLANNLANLFLSNLEGSDDDLVIRIQNAVTDSLRAEQLLQLKENPQQLKVEISGVLRILLETDAVFRRSVMSLPEGKIQGSSKALSIFISYRRTISQDFVRLLADKINRYSGIVARFDQEALRAGNFPIQLGRLVRQSDIFLLIVQPGSLSGIDDADNWIRREILTALNAGKAIIPVLVDADGELDNFIWPKEISTIGELQAITFKREYFDVSAKRLIDEMRSFYRHSK